MIEVNATQHLARTGSRRNTSAFDLEFYLRILVDMSYRVIAGLSRTSQFQTQQFRGGEFRDLASDSKGLSGKLSVFFCQVLSLG